MKQPAPPSTPPPPGEGKEGDPRPTRDASVARTDLELPDGRYLLVYSKPVKRDA